MDGNGFYLGTHMPHWLRLTSVPLFVSHRRLEGYRTLPRAKGRWALDSGGFSELGMFGRWETWPGEYVKAVRRYRDEIGGLDWAAQQDWMCEPVVRRKTGLGVKEHQRLTIENFLELKGRAPEVDWMPVIQGWEVEDYLRHADDWGKALPGRARFGVGSVCRRQRTGEAARIMELLAGRGLVLHGFGYKLDGLERAGRWMCSADSMAWSFTARREKALDGCKHRNCANCLRYALLWRKRIVWRLDRGW